MSVMKTYLAGPMTGIPQFNYPEFLRVTEILREEGWDIHNPVEMDDPAVFEQAWESQDGTFDGTVGGLTWGEILGKDVQYLSDDCDSLVLLQGWEDSKGARLEAFTAMNLGYDLFLWNGKMVTPMPYRKVLQVYKEKLCG